jgi:SAM-dependent methyltransferase
VLLSYVDDFLRSIELDPHIHTREAAFDKLRWLGLNDFSSVLWSMPLPQFPRLSSLLPKMAAPAVQRAWTGADGETLLTLAVSFMRSVSCNYSRITGASLHGRRILDFGCGYGRFTRLCYYYSDDVWAVDPWDEALALCREAGLTRNLRKSDELPQTLPIPDDFDLIIAFSVLTHTSERTTKTILKALRKHIRRGGLACITIRPIEYWKIWNPQPGQRLTAPELERLHRDVGFAFAPHNRHEVDGEITFGDTSMTTDWFAKHIPEWSLVAHDHSIEDSLQRYVFLSGS